MLRMTITSGSTIPILEDFHPVLYPTNSTILPAAVNTFLPFCGKITAYTT